MFPYERRDMSTHADVRPRRQIRPPAWMDDYEVQLPPMDGHPFAAAAPSQHDLLTQQPYYSQERRGDISAPPVLSSPWTQSYDTRPKYPRESVYSGPQYHSTPDPRFIGAPLDPSPAMQEELRQVREENRRLQATVMEIQRQLNASKQPDISLPPPPPSIARPCHTVTSTHTASATCGCRGSQPLTASSTGHSVARTPYASSCEGRN